ncbi:MAG: phosphate ABC transporter permease PstA [Anaerolineae bacterium]|nr:phosphate ABC transporter permease PstA [Anaerolineae bacterium]
MAQETAVQEGIMTPVSRRMRTNLKRRKISQSIAWIVLYLAGLLTVIALVYVIGYVLKIGLPEINREFLATDPRGGLQGEGGIRSTIITTFYLVGMVLVWAAPFGIGAGIYLTEYADDAVNSTNKLIQFLVKLARFGVETLAGVPSIIFGLFGYTLFVTALNMGFSLMAASLAGACLVLPTVIRTTEEALRTVPVSYRQASLALGATKWQTIYKVVLPAAAPGIITGVILSVGRVVGETAVFFVTLGGSSGVPQTLFSGGRSMALHVFYLAMDTRAFEKAMATGVILIISIVLINLLINIVSNRIQANLRGDRQ